MRIGIFGGSYVDVKTGRVIPGDLLLEAGKIRRIGALGDAEVDVAINGRGLTAVPGFVDIHVHLRDPGLTHKEDVFSGGEAAAAGGYTVVCAMPNTKPVCDCPEVIAGVVDKSKAAKTRIFPISAVTKGMSGSELVDFAAVQKAGAIAVSDDGLPVFDMGLLMQAMERCKALGLPVLLHCEDLSITGKGIMHEGEVSRRLGAAGVHRASEDSSTAAAVAIAAATGYPCHICHVSTAGSLALIREAKRRGVPVTCEVTPHHMCLTHDLLADKDANYRMAPPLREREDTAAVVAALADGTADCIATDHAPHTQQEKANFASAPNGIVGLETAFGVAYKTLVATGILTLPELVRKMSTNPAKVLGLSGGTLEVGAPADVALLDVNARWKVCRENLRSKSRNTPFHGHTLQGKVLYTICDGQITHQER